MCEKLTIMVIFTFFVQIHVFVQIHILVQIQWKNIVTLIWLTHAAVCHQEFYNNFDKLKPGG